MFLLMHSASFWDKYMSTILMAHKCLQYSEIYQKPCTTHVVHEPTKVLVQHGRSSWLPSSDTPPDDLASLTGCHVFKHIYMHRNKRQLQRMHGLAVKGALCDKDWGSSCRKPLVACLAKFEEQASLQISLRVIEGYRFIRDFEPPVGHAPKPIHGMGR